MNYPELLNPAVRKNNIERHPAFRNFVDSTYDGFEVESHSVSNALQNLDILGYATESSPDS